MLISLDIGDTYFHVYQTIVTVAFYSWNEKFRVRDMDYAGRQASTHNTFMYSCVYLPGI